MLLGVAMRGERVPLLPGPGMGRDDAKRVLLVDSYQAAQSLEKCRKP